MELLNNGSHQKFRVNRLVLEAFVGPCPDGHESNHKDGIKSNNDSENLEWVTHSENVQHAYRLGLKRCGWILVNE